MSAEQKRRTRHRSAPRTLTPPANAARMLDAQPGIAPAPGPNIDEPLLEAEEIQGHILPGFGTLHLGLLGLRISRDADSATHARRWLRELSPLITTLGQMQTRREVRRAVAKASGARPVSTDVLLNIALSGFALPPLGLEPPGGAASAAFLAGMNSVDLQDEKDANNVPVGWVTGATPDTTPDALLILGCDDESALRHAMDTLAAHTGPGSGLSVIYREIGSRLPDDREHFGFRDGLSQPAVRGRLHSHPESYLARRNIAPEDPLSARFARPGEPLIWPGQFLFGYPIHLDDFEPGPEPAPPVRWMRNGSYLVFRRLRQDVASFQRFADGLAPKLAEQLGRPVTGAEAQAWIVGRWPDGQPLTRQPSAPAPGAPLPGHDELNHFDYHASVADVTLADGSVIPGVNDDRAGLRCPHFAHIRKVNLRDSLTDKGPMPPFRMLRRGVPYGPAWQPGETETQDRGLLFLSFQRSLETFLTLSANWMNNASAPEGHGHDLLVGQNSAGRTAQLFRPGCPEARVSAGSDVTWIRATGGGFFFCPAVSVFRGLRTTRIGAEHRGSSAPTPGPQ